MREGYNWRQVLVHYAALSGVLAGFCVVFIALILGGLANDIDIFKSGITFSQISVLIFGLSTGLFIFSAELFLHAKGFDVFDLPDSYKQYLKKNVVGETKEAWERFEDENLEKIQKCEKKARCCYNFAIFALFFGLYFAITPSNFVIAFLVLILGAALELMQFF